MPSTKSPLKREHIPNGDDKISQHFGWLQQDSEGGPDAACTAALDEERCAWVSAGFSFAGLLNSGVHAFVPISIPLWSTKGIPSMPLLDRTSLYEASAIPATALEMVTLPSRLRGGPRPSKFVTALAPSNRPVCGILQACPLPPAPPSILGEMPGSNDSLAAMEPHFFDLTSMPAMPLNQYTSVVLRGADPRRLVNLTSRLPPLARQNSFVHTSALPLPIPFPQVFSEQDVECCPVATQLHAMAGGSRRSESLHRMATVIRENRFSAWSASVRTRYGVESDEFREVVDTILDHLDCCVAEGESDGELSD